MYIQFFRLFFNGKKWVEEGDLSQYLPREHDHSNIQPTALELTEAGDPNEP